MSEEEIKWYQLDFFAFKNVYQTCYGCADNEVLAFIASGAVARHRALIVKALR